MENETSLNHEHSPEAKPLLGDVFLDALLRTLNSVYKKFQLIKKEGSIYVIGYDKNTYLGNIPKEGGDLDIAYPEKDIVIIDRSCVVPFTKEYIENTGGWRKQYEDKDWLLGFTAGCKIFADIVRDKRERGVL